MGLVSLPRQCIRALLNCNFHPQTFSLHRPAKPPKAPGPRVLGREFDHRGIMYPLRLGLSVGHMWDSESCVDLEEDLPGFHSASTRDPWPSLSVLQRVVFLLME